MTRDGTFFIEDGKVRSGIKNMRFTEAITRALSSIQMIGAERRREPVFTGVAVVPALKISRFSFTGVTEF